MIFYKEFRFNVGMAQKGMVCVFRLLMYYSYGDDCLRLMWQRIIEYARMRNK
jgi:hypothetical protein